MKLAESGMGFTWSSTGRSLDVIAASGLISLLSLALPLAMLQIYDRILPGQGFATTNILALAVLTALVFETVLRLSRAYLISHAAAGFELRLSRKAFNHFLAADIAEVERLGAGEHLERFNAPGQLREFYSGQAAMTVLDLVFGIGFLVLMGYLGGKLVLIPLLAILALTLLAMGTGRAAERLVKAQGSVDEAHSSFLLSAFQGLQTAKVFGMEGILDRRNESLQEARTDATKRLDDLTLTLQNVAGAATQLVTVAVVALGSIAVMDGALTTGGLAACTMLSGRALQPCQAAIGLWTKLPNIREAHARLSDLFATPVASASAEVVSTSGVTDLAKTAEIEAREPLRLELRGVAHAYPGCSPLFSNISLTVEPGEFVAITGPNDSGKSTLLSIMRGLTQPTAGEVVLDGQPLRSWTGQRLRNEVAFVSQHSTLTRGTLLENLTMHRPEFEAQAMEAADILGFASDIHALPKGFHTRVGDGAGRPLPIGLVQRIALARAIVTAPRLLLFDSANTAVDDKGDNAIKALFSGLRSCCSLVVVSHRPSVLWLADRVHDLREGKIESQGLVVKSLKA